MKDNYFQSDLPASTDKNSYLENNLLLEKSKYVEIHFWNEFFILSISQ